MRPAALTRRPPAARLPPRPPRRAARAVPRATTTTAPPTTWDEWTAAFDAADDAADAVDAAAAALEAAVAGEDFDGAAKAKARLDSLQSRDGVARVAAALDDAVKREDYATAAALADAGATRIVGWWAAAPSQGDPWGHVLRVARDVGRYSGVALRAGELADAAADCAGADGVARIDGRGWSAPALEVLVHVDDAVTDDTTALPPTAIATQAAVLRPVFDFYDDGDGGGGGGDEDEEDEDAPPSPRGGVSVRVAAVPTGPLGPAAGAALRVDVTIPDGGDDDDDDAASTNDASIAARIVDAFDAARQRRRRRAEDDDEEGSSGADADADDDDAPTLGYAVPTFDVERAPASITWHGPDRFTLHAGGGDGVLSADGTYSNAAKPTRRRAAGEEAPFQGRHDWDSDDTDVVPDADDDGAPASPPGGAATADALRAAAADVARHVRAAADAAGAGPLPLSEDELAEYVRGSVADALAGALGAAPAAAAGAAFTLDRGHGDLVGDVTYTRLHTGPVSTDPFDGLYVGVFGAAGPELLHIQRAAGDGADTAIATRIASDGIPGCRRGGETRFKARVGRGDRLAGDGPYPPELGVRARYRGTAYVDAGGPDAAAPVDGELLLFSGRAPVTRGAAMGFVWGGAGDKRHLVLMSRVALDPVV